MKNFVLAIGIWSSFAWAADPNRRKTAVELPNQTCPFTRGHGTDSFAATFDATIAALESIKTGCPNLGVKFDALGSALKRYKEVSGIEARDTGASILSIVPNCSNYRDLYAQELSIARRALREGGNFLPSDYSACKEHRGDIRALENCLRNRYDEKIRMKELECEAREEESARQETNQQIISAATQLKEAAEQFQKGLDNPKMCNDETSRFSAINAGLDVAFLVASLHPAIGAWSIGVGAIGELSKPLSQSFFQKYLKKNSAGEMDRMKQFDKLACLYSLVQDENLACRDNRETPAYSKTYVEMAHKTLITSLEKESAYWLEQRARAYATNRTKWQAGDNQFYDKYALPLLRHCTYLASISYCDVSGAKGVCKFVKTSMLPGKTAFEKSCAPFFCKEGGGLQLFKTKDLANDANAFIKYQCRIANHYDDLERFYGSNYSLISENNGQGFKKTGALCVEGISGPLNDSDQTH